ncbi:MAG: efflux RND transporter periplasmic adaptor subunit [Planctomycetaceae bacterium]|nr:efflux RND transporter periplasmic adaptor subunit [Planctomycetaceae bacterium]
MNDRKQDAVSQQTDDGSASKLPDSATNPGQLRKSGIWWMRNLFSVGLLLAVGTALIAGIGLAQRMGWISAGGFTSSANSDDSEIHTCPMHPQIRQPGPGRCPICGMALVAASGGGADLDELSVQIEPAQRRLANIQTEPARLIPVNAEIRSVGSIAIDESRMSTISSYTSGRIERLFADYTGVVVGEKDHLAVVYSPDLYSAQVEYVEARRALSTSTLSELEIVRETQEKLVENSRRRLVELGMTDDQLEALEKTGQAQSRLTIYAPIGGTVIEKLTAEGDYVDAGEPIYKVANLATVWLMLELFPEDASRIRFGQQVTAEIQSLPGELLQGRVAFIDPTVNPRKRTVGVRVEFLNEDQRLRPGDYASATITVPIGPQGEAYDSELAGKWISPMHPQIIRDQPGPCPICGMDLVPTTRYGYSEHPVAQPASLVIPRSAVLMAGSHSVVYVEEEQGRFEVRVVTIGPILRDQVIVVDGLSEGEMVATAGNFLIDSQMQLAGKPSLIDPTRAIARQNERNTPLSFDSITVAPVGGVAGRQLEELYQAYFRIFESLANNEVPQPADAGALHELATLLAKSEELNEATHRLLRTIAERSEHLHHLSIDEARLEAFRPISHAIVTIATQARGEQASDPVFQMFCPMVEGGGGDWLQSGSELRNPYRAVDMPRCGLVVRELPVQTKAPSSDPDSDLSSGNDLSSGKDQEQP